MADWSAKMLHTVSYELWEKHGFYYNENISLGVKVARHEDHPELFTLYY